MIDFIKDLQSWMGRSGALRFVYIKILKKYWNITKTPYPRRFIHLPEILTPDAMERLMPLSDDRFFKAKPRGVGTGAACDERIEQ